MYTLDTNAIIYFIKGDEKTSRFFTKVFSQFSPVYVSTITEIELFGFDGLTHHESEQIERFLDTLTIVSLDSRIARVAGSLRRDYRLKTLDAAIAATALVTGTSLATRNIRDFKKIPNLSLQSI